MGLIESFLSRARARNNISIYIGIYVNPYIIKQRIIGPLLIGLRKSYMHIYRGKILKIGDHLLKFEAFG